MAQTKADRSAAGKQAASSALGAAGMAARLVGKAAGDAAATRVSATRRSGKS
jgi:hypothetical protein